MNKIHFKDLLIDLNSLIIKIIHILAILRVELKKNTKDECKSACIFVNVRKRANWQRFACILDLEVEALLG